MPENTERVFSGISILLSIHYVIPIPRESILTDEANNIQFNNILTPHPILKNPIKIKTIPARIERVLSEILNLLTIVVETKFPQLTKKVWKIAIKIGKIKPPKPIKPELRLTQDASTATANPSTKASFASI